MVLGGTRLSITTIRLGVLSFIACTILLFWSPHPSQYFIREHKGTSSLLEHNTQANASESERPATPSSNPPDTALSTKFHGSNDGYWNDLFDAFERSRPQCPNIAHIPKGLNDTHTKYEPLLPHKPHPHNINMTDEAEKELMRAHYSIRRAAFRLAPKLPYLEGTTGIVVTSNPSQMAYLLVSLRMLRTTGCQLPVELFLADKSEYNATMCEEVLPALNTRCVVMSQIFAPKIEHFQYKIFSMLLSSFQNVMFLDSDAFPIHDPTHLFETRPYTSHGLIIWPDLWGNTVSPHFYHIAGIPEIPVSTRRASETGQVLLDKSKHQESLLMSVYYNYYGPSHYYTIFSQGAPGPGDKDTFIQGAMAVDMPFYSVKSSQHGLGRHGGRGGEGFHMVGMAQRDPAEDFLYGPPSPNHVHEKDGWEDDNAADSESVTRVSQQQRPRPFFIHQMIKKIRPGIILRDDINSFYAEDGTWQRMWTSEQDVMSTFGYDAEWVMWKVLEHVSCVDRIEPEACETLKEYRKAVFGATKDTKR